MSLKQCDILVDVHSSQDGFDSSEIIGKKLAQLGAKISKRFHLGLTHVVWANGNLTIREKALNCANVRLVSPLWANECIETNTLVPEVPFFPVIPDQKKKTRKRIKSMEPTRADVFDSDSTRKTPARKTGLKRRLSSIHGVGDLIQSEKDQMENDSNQISAPSAKRTRRMTSSASKKILPMKLIGENDIITTPSRSRTSCTSWQCTSCTYDNVSKEMNCSMCGTRQEVAVSTPLSTNVNKTPASSSTPAPGTKKTPGTSKSKCKNEDEKDSNIMDRLVTAKEEVMKEKASVSAGKDSVSSGASRLRRACRVRMEEKACRRCTFVNPLEATSCGICDLALDNNLNPAIIDESSDDDSDREASYSSSDAKEEEEYTASKLRVSEPLEKKETVSRKTPESLLGTTFDTSNMTKMACTTKKIRPTLRKATWRCKNCDFINKPDVSSCMTCGKFSGQILDEQRGKVLCTRSTPRKNAMSLHNQAIHPKDSTRKDFKSKESLGANKNTKEGSSDIVLGTTNLSEEEKDLVETTFTAMASKSTTRSCEWISSEASAGQMTHLIVGTGGTQGDAAVATTKRTLKMLFALASGAWLLSPSWVFASLEKTQWPCEEEYEVDVLGSKKARKTQIGKNLLKSHTIHVARQVKPGKKVIEDLIGVAGGSVCARAQGATLILASEWKATQSVSLSSTIPVVSPLWLFDSITSLKLLDYDEYQANILT